MKKRKGFTLIEVVVAIAVLSIAMVGIGSAMYSGVKISAKNTKKVDTSVFAGNVIQTLKSETRTKLSDDYDLVNKNPAKGYCYFDNEDELNTILSNKINITTDARQNLIDGTWATMKTGKLPTGGPSNKKFGAYVEINSTNTLNNDAGLAVISNINYFKIYVKVIKLIEADNTDSSLVFYLGR